MENCRNIKIILKYNIKSCRNVEIILNSYVKTCRNIKINFGNFDFYIWVYYNFSNLIVVEM